MLKFLPICHFQFISSKIFRKINSKVFEIKLEEKLELFFNEHFQEISQRFFQALFIILMNILVSFFNIELIVKFLELPVKGMHFFQSAPGDYFITSITISWYNGLLFSLPPILSQFIFFLVPGLGKNEKLLILGLLISSIVLFFLGLFFSYFILTPAALQFFINYSYPVLEKLLSFNEYFSFIAILFFTTGLVFQLPIVQVLLSLAKILNPDKMLNAWRYLLIVSTVIAAILTPSADPFTQLLLAAALFGLYLSGSVVSKRLISK